MNTATYNKDFHRTVKKAEIPTCNILGVDIAAIDMEWLLTYLNNNIKALAGDYICVSNVHTTVTAYEEEAYRKVQNWWNYGYPGWWSTFFSWTKAWI